MTEPRDGAWLIARYRDAVEPSPEQLAAIRRDLSDPEARPRILEPRRRRARPAPRRGPGLWVGGGLVALAAAAAVAWWLGSSLQRATAVADDGGSQAPYEAEAREPAAEASRRAPARAGVEPAAIDPSAGAATQAPVPGVERGTVSPSSSVSSRSGSRPHATEPDPLVRETAIVERAEALLRDDDPTGALAVLDEHAREVEGGALAIERAALRVIALCQSGKVAQGRGEAVLLERHAASRPYRERMRRACAEE